jgi:hypothetical protein
MRKIAIELTSAIRANKSFSKANTSFDPSMGTVRFHGSVIAQNGAAGWAFSFRGFATATTRDRINTIRAALSLSLVGFVKGIPHVDGKAVSTTEWF